MVRQQAVTWSHLADGSWESATGRSDSNWSSNAISHPILHPYTPLHLIAIMDINASTTRECDFFSHKKP